MMNRGRKYAEHRSAATESPSGLRPNRLSRKCRLSQGEATEFGSHQNQQRTADFKTPTRILGSRAPVGLTRESPHSDSDCQHDIVWDATSPSPNRLGKRGRGRKYTAGAVNISEIVSRIAPKHGRPEVTEPTLQQWIGDSAAIPCTPDVQVPKPKKKSPRPTGVDDLLKLAKQFDFNMFRPDEDEVEDMHQQSVELLSEDILDFEIGDLSPPAAVNATKESEAHSVHSIEHTDEDLDFLFDGPTQPVSGNLTPASFAQLSPATPAPVVCRKAPSAGVRSEGTVANDKFDDDWENDDLLNDSLVLEMTQNPLKFAAPKHCSTQKSPAEASSRGSAVFHQSPLSKAGKQNVQQRATFRLDLNPNFHARKVQTNKKTVYASRPAGEDTQQSRFSYDANLPVQSVSSSNPTLCSPSLEKKSGVGSSQAAAAVIADTQDDLEAFFSSDPVWDEQADDNLLYEVCEDVENQIQSSANASIIQTRGSNQRAPLQPANQLPLTHKDMAAYPRLASPGVQVNAVRDQLRCSQTKKLSGSTHLQRRSTVPLTAPAPPSAPQKACKQFTFKKPNLLNSIVPGKGTNSFTYTQTKGFSGSTHLQQGGAVRSASAPPSSQRNAFKEPHILISTVTENVAVKCSAAEIQRKKQQAMERRQQRLLSLNLRAPT